MTTTTIISEADPLLVIYIDYGRSESTVYYQYDDGEEQSTPFQSADMSRDEQTAAREVAGWIES